MNNSKYPLTPLCELAMKYGTDKCPQIGHSYTPFYYDLLKSRRTSIKKVLEIGVGYRHMKILPNYVMGASLRMWRDFFPNAEVYGADILKECVFTDDRLITYHCDERNVNDLNHLISLTGPDIDLFIDDASHHIDDQIFLLQSLMPTLDKQVVYIVEDCLRTRQIHKTFPQYNCQIPVLLPNKNNVRGGLAIFTYK